MTAAARHAAVLADGTVPDPARLDAAWPGWDEGIDLVIAADGGARHAAALGLRIDRWVGDGDSIESAELAALAAAGVSITRSATDKDESDTELALRTAIEAGAPTITVLGALGGVRVDHTLANVGLLLDPMLDGRRVRLYDEAAARLSVLAGGGSGAERGYDLAGREGDIVTLLPLGGPAHGVTTSGLRYPLAGETLELGRARGLSNVRTAPTAHVSLTAGHLLAIETPARLRP